MEPEEEVTYATETPTHLMAAEEEHHYLTPEEVNKKIKEYEALMKQAAKEMHFEEAAQYRDLMRRYQQIELSFG